MNSISQICSLIFIFIFTSFPALCNFFTPFLIPCYSFSTFYFTPVFISSQMIRSLFTPVFYSFCPLFHSLFSHYSSLFYRSLSYADQQTKVKCTQSVQVEVEFGGVVKSGELLPQTCVRKTTKLTRNWVPSSSPT